MTDEHQPTPPALHQLSVLITTEQKEEINRLTQALYTPSNRMKKSSVVRMLLDLGTQAAKRRIEEEGSIQP